MTPRRRIAVLSAVAGTLLPLLFCAPAAHAQAQSNAPVGGEDALPTMVEVYWQSYKTVVVHGITNVIVLDQDIAQAETGYDTIKFTGVGRGETVALGYMNGKPVSMRIRVVQRPVAAAISPGSLQRQAELAQGTVSSTVQSSSTGGPSTVALVNGFSWTQPAGKNGRFDFSSQAEDDTFAGGFGFNLRTGSATYQDPHLQVRAIDFTASLSGGGLDGNGQSGVPISINDTTELRGAAIGINRGDNRYEFFAGTTIPSYFLSLGATRDVAGFTFRRKFTRNFSVFATTGFLNAPLDFLGVNSGRRNNYMQTAGFNWVLNPRWTVQGAGGESNHGGMVRGQVLYHDRKLTAYASGLLSSTLFPINQLGSLFSGTSSLQTGATYKNKDWLTETIAYQHVVTPAIAGITTSGSSDSASPGVTVKLGAKQNATFNYTYSRNSGGFAGTASSGNQFNAYHQYLFTPQVSNSFQYTVGSVQDPLQLNSQDQYMLRDTVFFPVFGHNTMFVSYEHDQTNPSLVSKLQQELSLLSPALQNLFLTDPAAFVDSNNLPPEIRALLNAQNQLGDSIFATGQFRWGSKINFSPSVSLNRNSAIGLATWTPYVGYGLTYRATRTLQLNSSLTNQWVLANNFGGTQHTLLFSFGVVKTFTALPQSFSSPLHSSHVIEGRVFRDDHVKGFFSAGESGFRGLQVRLENGDVVMTDELGRYKFTGVSGGVHTVSLDLNQFGQAIRMTTKANIEVDLIRSHVAVANFGVVDFARLLGTVFNDLRFEGKRQPDSKDMPQIQLILDNGKTRRNIMSQSGGFEVDDLPPGDYTLTVDANTVPPNYIVSQDSFRIHVSPISSVIQDIPVRALRSIAGRVFLKVSTDPGVQTTEAPNVKIGGIPQSGKRGGQAAGKLGQAGGQVSHNGQQGAGGQGNGNGTDYNLVPMAGIQLHAGGSTTISDENGNFLLRDLPAGDLMVTIMPLKPMPPGMQVPSGLVRMPAEPIQVQGATIVISDPALVPYLIGKTAEEVRDAALHPKPKPVAPTAVPVVPVPDPTGTRGVDGSAAGQDTLPDIQPNGGNRGGNNNIPQR
jgi:hypothetical protein